MPTCPCCSSKPYEECCKPYISADKLPQTPEQLMRSRYTAYTQRNWDYIRETMLSPAADQFDAISAEEWASKITWIGLNVVKASHQKTTGIVEFVATYTIKNHPEILHEISEFRCEQGKWYYVDGRHQ